MEYSTFSFLVLAKHILNLSILVLFGLIDNPDLTILYSSIFSNLSYTPFFFSKNKDCNISSKVSNLPFQ